MDTLIEDALEVVAAHCDVRSISAMMLTCREMMQSRVLRRFIALYRDGFEVGLMERASLRGAESRPSIVRSHCWLNGYPIAALCALLRTGTFRALHTLRLDDSHLGDAGAVEIAGAIPRMTTLRVLTLVENQVGPIGVGRVVDALILSRVRLRVLVLSHNALGVGGIAHIARAVLAGALSHAEELLLDDNLIGNEGVMVLTRSVVASRRLFSDKKCDVAGNFINNAIALDNLRKLNLFQNQLDDYTCVSQLLDHLPNLRGLFM